MLSMKTSAARAAALAALVTPVLLPTAAWAQTSLPPVNLDVTAQVTENCLLTTSPVSFGPVNTTSTAATNALGSLEVTCTADTGWTARSDGGQNGTFAMRAMDDGAGNLLNYQLFTESTRTVVWGDTSAGTSQIIGTGTGTEDSVTIYGQVPGSQFGVPAGNYADVVAVTLSY